jgi:cardiolipin synthase
MHPIIELLAARWRLDWFGSLTALSELLALMTIPSVLLRRQGQPRAALSWLLAMFAIPALGVIAWWAIGRTRIERKRRKLAESKRETAERRGTPHSEVGTPFDGILPPRALGDSIFATSGNAVDLLFEGPIFFLALHEVIGRAKKTIHLQFYIFKNDATGQALRALLVQKAREGVVVRVLVDGWGTPWFTGSFSEPLRAAGAHVAAFLPSRFRSLLAPRLNFTNHRKVVIIDEATAFVGGMNVGDEYATEWRDVMVKISGPAVRALDHVFIEDWDFASNEDVTHREFDRPPPQGSAACAVISSGPDRDSYIHDAFFTLFAHAEQRVWIVTPYFIPSDAIGTALRTAADHGVDVRIIIPSKSDVAIVKHAARSYYLELLKGGVRIYEYEGPMLHAKAIVIDWETSVVGSANVDTRSFKLSFEVSCVFRDEATCAKISTWCEDLLAHSHQVTIEECLNRSTGEKLIESAAHLFSPLL